MPALRRLATVPALGAALFLAMACDDGTDPGPEPVFTFETAFTFEGAGLAEDDFIIGFDFAPDGTLWAITFQGTILRSAGGEVTAFDATDFAGPVTNMRDVIVDPQGRPWVTWVADAAPEGVAAVYDGGAWHVEGPDDLMGTAPKGWAVAVNDAGDVMVGVGDAEVGGVFLRPAGSTAWQLFTPENSALVSRLVNAIGVGPDGSFWVAAGQGYGGVGGVTRILDGAVVATYSVDDGLLYNEVSDVAYGDGRVWLAYRAFLFDEAGPDGGLQAMPLDGGPLETWYPHTTDRVSSRVRKVAWSSAGELWFVTGLDEQVGACDECVVGVGYLDATGTLHAISHRDTDLAPNEFLTEIREGPDGRIYFARAGRNEIVRVVR
jgi:hypothetical protein